MVMPSGAAGGRASAGAALVVADYAKARRQPVDERVDADRPAALRQQHRQRRTGAALLVVDAAAFDLRQGHVPCLCRSEPG